MFVKIIYAILAIGTGLAILKYRKSVYDWTGRWYWAEKYLWNGGTVTAITLAGLLLIGFGAAYPFGAFDSLGNWTGQAGLTPTQEARNNVFH